MPEITLTPDTIDTFDRTDLILLYNIWQKLDNCDCFTALETIATDDAFTNLSIADSMITANANLGDIKNDLQTLVGLGRQDTAIYISATTGTTAATIQEATKETIFNAAWAAAIARNGANHRIIAADVVQTTINISGTPTNRFGWKIIYKYDSL